MSIEILEVNDKVNVVARKQIVSSFNTTEDAAFISFENLTPHDAFKDIADMMSTYSGSESFPTGILPPGVLAITKTHIVFERQPEYKTIFVIPKTLDSISDLESERIYTYQIPLPWQLYIIQYGHTLDNNGDTILYPSNVRLHFMKNNLSHADQEVYMAPLTNLYANGTLCRPMFSSMEEFERYPNTIAGVIEAAYDWVWNSGSNLDLTICPLSMYIQFCRSDFYSTDPSNTIWKNTLNILSHNRFSYDQFYCGFDHVDMLYRAWEQFSLSDIVSFDWPTNYTSTSWRVDALAHEAKYLSDYKSTDTSEPFFDLHYDEENDEEYQCELDPDIPLEDQCYCLHPHYHFNKMKFYVDTGLLPLKPKTYRETFETFIQETKIPTIYSSNAKNFYDLNILKILHSI